MAKFREKRLMLVDEMELLFGDVVATGEQTWAPSSGTLLDQPIKDIYVEGSGDSYDSPPTRPLVESSAQLSITFSKGKEKSLSTSFIKQAKKQRPSTSVQVSLERLSDVVETVKKKDGVEACITVLDSLNINYDQKFYYDCLCLLANKKDARKFLLCLKDPESQLGFLRQILQ